MEKSSTTLSYETAKATLPAAGFGILSLLMAAVTILWLLPVYLCWTGWLTWGPFAEQRGGPLGESLTDNALWPVGITILLAVIGFLQPRRRRRWLGAVAIVAVCIAYPALMPGLWR